MAPDCSVTMSPIVHLLWQFGGNLSDGRYAALFWFRNGAAGVEAVDVAAAEPEFGENLFVVLADFRGAFGRHFRDAMPLNRAADCGRQLSARALDGNDDVIRTQLRIIADFLRPTHGAEGDVNPVEDLVPVRH